MYIEYRFETWLNFAKIASLQGAGTFIAIFASPLVIFAKIASLEGATFGIHFKSPEAGDFSPFLPFSPWHAFLDIIAFDRGNGYQIISSGTKFCVPWMEVSQRRRLSITLFAQLNNMDVVVSMDILYWMG